MQSPVLLLVFNRPEKTAAVMDRLRAARPPRLYVAADGPRMGRAAEADRCAQVRAIATAVDWPCEVKTLFREQNLGCKLGVSGGIDWFFTQESEGIILEDDILATPDFFRFCDEMLARYRDDPSIAMIGGSNLAAPFLPPDAASWRFTRYPQIWGWASWRRAWAQYDVNLQDWPAARPGILGPVGPRRIVTRQIADLIDRTAAGQIDTWDYQWMFACLRSGMLSVLPAQPLIENIGFDAEATHTVGVAPDVVQAARPAPMAFPLVPPANRDPGPTDRALERQGFGFTLEGWARLQVRRRPWLLGLLKQLRGPRSPMAAQP